MWQMIFVREIEVKKNLRQSIRQAKSVKTYIYNHAYKLWESFNNSVNLIDWIFFWEVYWAMKDSEYDITI